MAASAISPTTGAVSKPAQKAIAANSKPEESKSDRFRRLANRRVPRAIKVIAHVRNLASRSNYEYSEQQAAKILTALTEAVRSCERAFAGSDNAPTGWSL